MTGMPSIPAGWVPAGGFSVQLTVAHVIPLPLVPKRRKSNPLVAFTLGSGAGLSAAVLLYPFDFVRMATVGPGQSHFAYSTIPYMGVYLGIWHAGKPWLREGSFRDRVGLAALATASASAVELPLDRAKVTAAGGLRAAGITALLRVPLGSLLLIAYDTIATGLERRRS